MFDQNLFATRIKQLRLKRNLTQSNLGAFLGVTKTQISDIENGKIGTSLEKLVSISECFEVSTDYLLGRSDNPFRHV